MPDPARHLHRDPFSATGNAWPDQDARRLSRRIENGPCFPPVRQVLSRVVARTMQLRRSLFTVMALGLLLRAAGQAPAERARAIALESLLQQGFSAEDLGDLIVKDDYASTASGVRHIYLRQRWQGIEVWNGDIAVHLNSDGGLLTMNNGAWSHMAKRVNTTTP